MSFINFAIYITTNPNRSVLYRGTTNNLQRRVIEHYLKSGRSTTFAGKNYCYNVVFYDVFPTMMEAIEAEKRIKGKSRKWKEKLIESINPKWEFLNKEILGEWPPKKILEEPYFIKYLEKFG